MKHAHWTWSSKRRENWIELFNGRSSDSNRIKIANSANVKQHICFVNSCQMSDNHCFCFLFFWGSSSVTTWRIRGPFYIWCNVVLVFWCGSISLWFGCRFIFAGTFVSSIRSATALHKHINFTISLICGFVLLKDDNSGPYCVYWFEVQACDIINKYLSGWHNSLGSVLVFLWTMI